MNVNLSDLNVMVTRPNPAGAILCAYIESHGGHAINFPTMEFASAIDQQLFQQSIDTAGNQDWLISSTRHGVEHRRISLVILRVQRDDAYRCGGCRIERQDHRRQRARRQIGDARRRQRVDLSERPAGVSRIGVVVANNAGPDDGA